MTFFLLRLPQLAGENVVALLNGQEQYNVAMVSRNAKKLVASCTRRQRPHTLSVDLRPNQTEMILQDSHDILRVYQLFVDPDEAKIKEQLYFATRHIASSFSCSLITVAFNGASKTITEFLQLVNQLRLMIQRFKGNVIEGNDVVYQFILRECRNCPVFELSCATSKQFAIDYNRAEPFKFEKLNLHNADWIRAEHIINWFSECREFRSGKCQIGPEALNWLIRRWIRGSKLEIMRFPCRNVANFGEMLNGIPADPTVDIEAREQQAVFTPGNAFKIQQDSGVEALVTLFDGHFTLVTIEGGYILEVIGEGDGERRYWPRGWVPEIPGVEDIEDEEFEDEWFEDEEVENFQEVEEIEGN